MLSQWKARTPAYKANLAGYCFLTFAATLVLLYAGGFTTTIGAGMVFADWPLSNGSWNPPGWTTDEAMLAEHGHRLMGWTVGTLVIGLCAWMYFREERKWLRWLSYGALALVVFQGVLGGLRVLLVNVDLAKVHGVTAQVFLCVLASIAVGSARWWRDVPTALPGESLAEWVRLRRFGILLCAVTILQLMVGAVMRHRGAGMAIPYFPHAAPSGSFLPVAWNWATALHFSHRVIAVVIFVGVIWWAYRLHKMPWTTQAMRRMASFAMILVSAQVLLGGLVIWTTRMAIPTTLHVLNGAILLSLVWATTFAFFRTSLESGVAAGGSRAAPAPPIGGRASDGALLNSTL